MRACVVFALATLILAASSPAHAQRALFLVRHADKLDESKDPPLSEAGQARARALAGLLKDAGITAIYTSEFQRTIRTAEPFAVALKIAPVSHPVMDREGLLRRLRSDHRDDVVLVVGHDRSVPALLKAYGHPEPITIAPDEYTNLFVLVPRDGGPPVVLRLRY